MPTVILGATADRAPKRKGAGPFTPRLIRARPFADGRQIALSSNELLCPPKPSELFKHARIFTSRAWLGT